MLNQMCYVYGQHQPTMISLILLQIGLKMNIISLQQKQRIMAMMAMMAMMGIRINHKYWIFSKNSTISRRRAAFSIYFMIL
mmetsp:Transcript_23790/g.27139  ORF Transcript_23790/g.27139 Transcript_23790/m.27139 type:complete len:81 (-) Transcript_23790:211-453(-)